MHSVVTRKRKVFHKLGWLGILLIAIGVGSIPTAAQVVGIRSDPVDVCGKTSRVVLVVTVGTISLPDSLLSFFVEIGYDPAKVLLTTLLKTNTLSEGMDFVQMTAVEDGVVIVQGGNVTRFLQNPASEAALFAISGTLRSPLCPDTVYLAIRRVGFGQVQGNEIVDVAGTVGEVEPVVLFVKDKPDRYAQVLVVEADTVVEQQPEDTLRFTLRLVRVFDHRVDTVQLWMSRLYGQMEVQHLQVLPLEDMECSQPVWNAAMQRYEWQCSSDSDRTSVDVEMQAVIQAMQRDTTEWAISIAGLLPKCHCIVQTIAGDWKVVSNFAVSGLPQVHQEMACGVVMQCRDGLIVRSSVPNVWVTVSNSIGMNVKRLWLPYPAVIRIPTAGWSRGLYIVDMRSGNGKHSVYWILK